MATYTLKKIIIFLLVFIHSEIAFANAVNEYELGFLKDSLKNYNFDSSWINSGIAEGMHSIDVSINDLNGASFDLIKMKVNFIHHEGDVQPCFSYQQLQQLKIKPSSDQLANRECFLVADINPEARFYYKSNKSLVQLFIPSISFEQSKSRTYTEPELWEEGINNLKFKYNSYLSTDKHGNVDGYLGLNTLLSLDKWRLKHSGSYYRSNNYSQGLSGDLYAFTDVDSLYSQFSLGEISSTSGFSVNSSIPITGISLVSSELMTNPNWSSYAPVIRGRVNSLSARVSVLDNQRVIYSEELSTGEFEIRNFDVSATGSDLSSD